MFISLVIAVLIHGFILEEIHFKAPPDSKLPAVLELNLSYRSDNNSGQATHLSKSQHPNTEPAQPKIPQTLSRATEPDTLVSNKPVPDSQSTHIISSSLAANNKQDAASTQSPPIKKTSTKKAEKTQAIESSKAPATIGSLHPPIDLKAEIARLDTPWNGQQETNNHGYRIKRFSTASSWNEPGAQYREAWRRKVERIGNMNYPEEARKKDLYGKLQMRVSINRDGSLHEIKITQPSGYPVLDKAAIRIVKMAAPFAPFGHDLNDYDRIEMIRTWIFEKDSYFSFP